jgi:hypothetical protein
MEVKFAVDTGIVERIKHTNHTFNVSGIRAQWEILLTSLP